MKDIVPPSFCPKCSATSVAFISYGLPDFSVIDEELKSGKIVLGGCIMSEESPQWRCIKCFHEWGELLDIQEIREIRIRSELKKEKSRLAAIERGVMDALVNEFGAVKCPYCGLNFRIKHGLSKEGAHINCGTFLNLIPKE